MCISVKRVTQGSLSDAATTIMLILCRRGEGNAGTMSPHHAKLADIAGSAFETLNHLFRPGKALCCGNSVWSALRIVVGFVRGGSHEGFILTTARTPMHRQSRCTRRHFYRW